MHTRPKERRWRDWAQLCRLIWATAPIVCDMYQSRMSWLNFKTTVIGDQQRSCADPQGECSGVRTPPGKSQVAIGFLINTDTDPPREAIGSNWFSREVRMTLCEMHWWLKLKLSGPLPPHPWWIFLDPCMWLRCASILGSHTQSRRLRGHKLNGGHISSDVARRRNPYRVDVIAWSS